MEFRIGVEGAKATLIFNGPIDGEPAITGTGAGTMTVDPKVEVATPSPDDRPDFIETRVVCHFRNADEGATGPFGISGSAVADNPATSEQETILIDFPEVGVWILPAQAKATGVAIATESEPI